MCAYARSKNNYMNSNYKKYMKRILKRLYSYLYYKIKYRKYLEFRLSTAIRYRSTFEGMNTIGKNSQFGGKMGWGSYMGSDCVIYGKIGRFCSIAPSVKCTLGRHPMFAPFVTTCQLFYSLRRIQQREKTFVNKQIYDDVVHAETNYTIVVGNDCWIGQGALIVGGVTIADGAVVLAHAVVTKDVPPYAVVGGVPAKILRYRYDEETRKFLLDVQWWNKDIIWLRQHANLLCDIDKFKQNFSNE